MSDDNLPREVSRGVMKLGPLEFEVIVLDNGKRLITEDGVREFLLWIESGGDLIEGTEAPHD